MSSTLERLVGKSRPFKPFTVTIGDETFSLQVRKASALESSMISEAWDSTYRDTVAKESEEDINTAPLYNSLRNQSPEKLAEFIAKANGREIRSEAMIILGDKPSEKKVEAEVDRLTKEMIASLLDSHEAPDLYAMACERQRHFYALGQASDAVNKAMTRAVVYDEEGKKMFANGEEEELSSEDIKTISDAAIAALS